MRRHPFGPGESSCPDPVARFTVIPSLSFLDKLIFGVLTQVMPHVDLVDSMTCAGLATTTGVGGQVHGPPKFVYVREDAILGAVARFFADRVFGTDHRAILAADLAGVDDRATREQ